MLLRVYNTTKGMYELAQIHKHLLVSGYTAEPLLEDSARFLEQWFRDLVDAIDMNILVEPEVVWCDTPGNEGITGGVVIDTSHIYGHWWVADKSYYRFDLYSCKDYDVDTVFEFLKQIGTTHIDYEVIDRTLLPSVTIERGTRDYGY